MFAFAPASKAAAGETGGELLEVTRSLDGAPQWRFTVRPETADAIRMAARLTGADFEYMVRTAALESSFNGALEAGTSSAMGLYQFIEQTWFFMVRDHGAEAGIGPYALAIVEAEEGGWTVEDEFLRDEILGLRGDPALSAVMAGIFTRRNAEHLSKCLGREPDAVELYIGHLLGPSGAVKLIRLVDSKPAEEAVKHFRAAARANRGIFYDDRRPRSVREVRELIAGKYAAIAVRRAPLAPPMEEAADPPVPPPPLPVILVRD